MQQEDVVLIVDYWHNSSDEHLIGMGVDLDKLPGRDDMMQGISTQLGQSFEEKNAYALIWELNGKPVGHCNINEITFGSQANMHLHIWEKDNRRLGYGIEWVRMSLPFYLTNFELQTLICEPMRSNPGPNRLLKKLGFIHEKDYVTIPGSHCFEQEVSRWTLSNRDI